MRAFVTVIGKDKIGIINEVTTVLREMKINVLDINQTLIQEYFNMIMLVDLTDMQGEYGGFKAGLEDVAARMDMSIWIQREDIFNAMHNI